MGQGPSAALQRLATCVVRLEGVTELQRDALLQLAAAQQQQQAGAPPLAPHGLLSCSFTSRKAGALAFVCWLMPRRPLGDSMLAERAPHHDAACAVLGHGLSRARPQNGLVGPHVDSQPSHRPWPGSRITHGH